MPAEVETMFSAREVPWHGIGTVVPDALTAEEAIRESGLDWEVTKEPFFVKDSSGEYHLAPRFYATVRSTDGRILGSVKEDYTVFQNRDAFSFADNLVDSGEAKYETAGSLFHGAWVWLTMKMPKQVLIAGDDPVDMYLLLNSSHDGSKAITASVTPVRVVCMNTLNLALRGARQQWQVKHVANIGQRLHEAREALQLTFRYAGEFEELANELAAQSFSEEEFNRFLEELLPQRPRTEDVASQIRQLFVESPTLENVRGTKWAALNAVGEYYSWIRPTKTAESRVKGDIVPGGANVRMRNDALKLLVAA